MEALVDVGARVTNIIVHEGGVPRFVRILLMGGADVTDALAERTGSEQTEAEALKHEMGMSTDTEDPEAQAAGRVMEAAGQAFVDQVRGSLDYYTASPGCASDRPDRRHRRRLTTGRPGRAAVQLDARRGRARDRLR